MFRALADFNNSLRPAVPAVVIVAPAVVAPIPGRFNEVTGTWDAAPGVDPTIGRCFKFGNDVPCVAGAVYDAPPVALHCLTKWNKTSAQLLASGLPDCPAEATDDPPTITECEDKPYIQYKDELHVFGEKATLAQLCQIKSQASLSCDRELIKITLALKAADVSIEGCADPSSLPLLETGW